MRVSRRARIALTLVVLFTLTVLCIFEDLSWVSADESYTFSQVWAALTGHGTWSSNIIVCENNAPRVVVGIFVGAGLAVTGAAMQAVFRNPLASPYILGLSSGASLGAAIGMLFTIPFIPAIIVTPVLAFITCFATMVLVYAMSRSGGGVKTETLILSGVAVSSLLSALVSFLTFIAGDKLEGIVFWSMGNLGNASWEEIAFIAPIVVVCCLLLITQAKPLNAMMIGDAHAMDLGIDVKKTRLFVLILSTMTVAAAVSFVGVIGFIGLVIPHILRILIGPDNRHIMPLSMVAGGWMFHNHLRLPFAHNRTLLRYVTHRGCHRAHRSTSVHLPAHQQEEGGGLELTLEVKDLKFQYKDHLVLDGIDLPIIEGEVIGILGPNGCGKTTLLKNLNKNLSPCGGCVLLNDEDMANLTKKEIAREIAVVPQTNEVHFAFTVRDMVAMGRMPFQGMMSGASSEDERIVDEAIERTGLSKYVDRHINTMSGGERQRVIIARAIAQTPKILLMDEPTLHLDISMQFDALNLVHKLSKETGLTVVIVSHDLAMVARYCDRIVMIHDHKIHAIGRPEQVLTEENMRTVFNVDAELFFDKKIGRYSVMLHDSLNNH